MKGNLALLQQPPALRELVHQLGEEKVEREPGQVGTAPVQDGEPRGGQPRLLGRHVPRVHRPLHDAHRQAEEEDGEHPPQRGPAGGHLHGIVDIWGGAVGFHGILRVEQCAQILKTA